MGLENKPAATFLSRAVSITYNRILLLKNCLGISQTKTPTRICLQSSFGGMYFEDFYSLNTFNNEGTSNVGFQ